MADICYNKGMDSFARIKTTIPSNGTHTGWMKAVRRVEMPDDDTFGFGQPELLDALDGEILENGFVRLEIGTVVARCVPSVIGDYYAPNYMLGVGRVGIFEIEWERSEKKKLVSWTLDEAIEFAEFVASMTAPKGKGIDTPTRSEIVSKVNAMIEVHCIQPDEIELKGDWK